MKRIVGEGDKINMKKGKLDMIVGGQYGDEGKGSCALMLDDMNEYNFSVRVGGSQAEHRFKYDGKNYRFRVLPSLAAVEDVNLLLGAGHIIRKDIMEQEILRYNIDKERIYIDINAMVVSGSNLFESRQTASRDRGGYAMGTSPALITKIERNPKTMLANEILGLEYQIVDVSHMVNRCLISDNNGLIEGTQGALLSLNHGYYPYVTSYDVTPAAILGQIGIGWRNVRDVYGIYKYYPTRVSGESGKTGGKEITFDDIEGSHNLVIPNNRKYQCNEDGTFGNMERIFEWSWYDFEKSIYLTEPSKMILTHLDWANSYEYAEQRISDMGEVATKILGRSCMVEYVRNGENIDDYEVINCE